jgi:HPt (histidine-containing phosphotransfer) domain-containing protein
MPALNADYSNLNYDEMAIKIGLKAKHIPMLIGSFLEESSTIIPALKNALDTKNFNEIVLRAHSLKGSAGNLRFTEVYEMAKEMELNAQESQADFDYGANFEAIKVAIATIPN